MTKIEAVIFDIGNVLVEWHPERPYDRLIGAAARKALFERIDLMGMNIREDLGADLTAELTTLAQEHPDDAELIWAWKEHWLEMLAPDYPHSAKLLRALRARGVPVYALSNFGSETLAMAEPLYPVLTEFDIRFVSADLGLIKPDPAIYAHVEAHVPHAPDTLLFTDDRPENIDAATARGWRTHLFETPAGLADRLIGEGLLTQEEAAP